MDLQTKKHSSFNTMIAQVPMSCRIIQLPSALESPDRIRSMFRTASASCITFEEKLAVGFTPGRAQHLKFTFQPFECEAAYRTWHATRAYSLQYGGRHTETQRIFRRRRYPYYFLLSGADRPVGVQTIGDTAPWLTSYPLLRFAILIAAQFFAVIYCVRHHRQQSEQEVEEQPTRKKSSQPWQYTADL